VKRIHIVGRKNSGKTTLVVDLVQGLTARGLRVATIKHTHHQHELDTPGKDSWEHRQAGAAIVGILAKNMTAVFLPQSDRQHSNDRNASSSPSGEIEEREARYQEIAPLLGDVDLILVEGHLTTHAPKIEVWRADNQTEPIFPSDPSIIAVISDTSLADLHPPKQFPRSELESLIQWLLREGCRGDKRCSETSRTNR
jgi:molybdopterin-guanine dinucleotide biosynthesis protein B